MTSSKCIAIWGFGKCILQVCKFAQEMSVIPTRLLPCLTFSYILRQNIKSSGPKAIEVSQVTVLSGVG